MTIKYLEATSGRYLLLKEIGRGGMGTVHSANLLGSEGVVKTVAIKVMAMVLAFSDSDRERFINEARIAAQLDHSCIVSVLDIGEMKAPFETHGTPFLVMQWVDGVDLRKLVKAVGQRFSPDVTLFIVGQILAALEYAHDRTIGGVRAAVTHYDVTPGNILISSSGEVKLTDFGIARFANSVEGTLSQAIGTPRYMSPEQFGGKGNEKSDIYSLGIVLHELLEGKRYLEEHDNVTHQNLVMSGHVPELTQRDVPPWLDTLRRNMLALAPEARPTAADARAIILEKASHYQLASKRLVEVYTEFIGEKRSGLTALLELEELGLECKRLPVPSRVATQPAVGIDNPLAAAAPDEPTVAERGEEDSPSVFRRRATPKAPEQADTTFTDGPPLLQAEEPQSQRATWPDRAKSAPVEVEPTIRLPAMFGEDLAEPVPTTGQQWPTTLPPPDPSAPPRRTLQQLPGRSVAMSSPASSLAAVPVAAAAPQQRSNSMTWVVGALGSSIIILLAVVVGLVVTASRSQTAGGAEGPVALEPAPPDDVGSRNSPAPAYPEVAPILPEPAVAEPAAQLALEPDADGAELQIEIPVASDEPPTATPTEPTTEQVPEVEPEPKPKPKPKPKIHVVLAVTPAAQDAQVKVGSRLLKYNYAASTKLTPGTYRVRWRAKPEDPWHTPGSLVVDEIGSTEFYDVRVSATKITMNVRKQGSAK